MVRTVFVSTIIGVALCYGLVKWLYQARPPVVGQAMSFVPQPVPRFELPVGTRVRVKLIQGVTESSKDGDFLQALVDEPVVINGNVMVEHASRALVHLLKIEDSADTSRVVLTVDQITVPLGRVSVITKPISLNMKRTSDFELIGRAAGAMVGGAVGAARSASRNGNPGFGAANVGGRTTGSTLDEDDQQVVDFEIRSSGEPR